MSYWKFYAVAILLSASATFINAQATTKPSVHSGEKVSDISKRLGEFKGSEGDKIFRLTIAADVPDNKRPNRVHLKREPGHVFIILEKIDTLVGAKSAIVWGFYPIRPITSLIFRNAKSMLRGNDGREYDASISRFIDSAELINVLSRVDKLASRKYNINKYNCYDYAIDIYNAAAKEPVLSYKHVKFPLIFGRGGSPCALYEQLVDLQSKKTISVGQILIASGKAPGNLSVSQDNNVVAAHR